MGFLVGIGCLSMWVIWPASGWRFTLQATVLVNDWIEGEDATEKRMYRNLALYLDENFTANATKLQRRYWAYRCAVLLLTGEVVVLIYALR